MFQSTYVLVEENDYDMMFDHISVTTYLPLGFSVYLI